MTATGLLLAGEVTEIPDWSYQTVFRPLLFRLPPRTARDFTLNVMGRLASLPLGPKLIELLGHMRPPASLQTELCGIHLVSPVGLDAGLDPSALAPHALGRFGVGFVEIGPVTVEPVRAPLPVGRTEDSIWYPDLPVNEGVSALKERLWRHGPLPAPAGVRLAHRPGASPAEAGRERVRLIGELAAFAAFFTVETRAGSAEGWDEEIRLLVEAARAVDRPILLCLTPDLPPQEAGRLLEPALAAGIGGVVISGGVAGDNGRIEGPGALEPSLQLLRFLRQELNLRLPIVVSGGVQSPADALRLLDAGATVISLHSGLVFTGPGLPKRINEAVTSLRRRGQTDTAGTGWLWGTLTGLGVQVIGLMAMLVALTSVVLPYDEAWVGLRKTDLDAINPRLLAFMAHDRISVAGTSLANGIVFTYLSWFGLRRGDHWALQTFKVGCAAGFAAFFLFLGHGRLDPLHLLAFLVLLPFYLLTLVTHRTIETVVTPSLHNDRAWRLGQWGQLLFVALGAGIMVTGVVIAAIGVTFVFVPQDLGYLQTTAAFLQSVKPELVPLIAHDRAGFGGALITNGLTILLASLWGFRPGERWLWWAMFVSGVPSYVAALWTHLAIGYTDFIHLLPVYVALAVFLTALALSRPYLMGRPAEVGW